MNFKEMFEILHYPLGLDDFVYTCCTLHQNVYKDNISSLLTLLHIMENVCVAIAYIDIRKQFEKFSTREMKLNMPTVLFLRNDSKHTY